MFHDASYWIDHLKMIKHIEGGYFTEIYQSALFLDTTGLPTTFSSSRHCCTHIYFLLENDQFSALHRIKSDELWHFYAGNPLIIYEIGHNGNLTEHLLGQNPETGEQLFTYVKAGSWFGAKLQKNEGYALVGCTVSPGFDYADFELAGKEAMMKLYPMHQQLIESLTR